MSTLRTVLPDPLADRLPAVRRAGVPLLLEVVDVEPPFAGVLFEQLPAVEALERRVWDLLEDSGLMDGPGVGDVGEEQAGHPGAALGSRQRDDLGVLEGRVLEPREALGVIAHGR